MLRNSESVFFRMFITKKYSGLLRFLITLFLSNIQKNGQSFSNCEDLSHLRKVDAFCE